MIRRITRSTIAAVMLALFATLAMVPLAAQAANNSHIQVSLDSFTRITQQGEEITTPGQVNVGDWLLFKVSFDATNADPVPGDSFSVTLPAEFSNIEFGRPGREVIKPMMFGTVQVGSCTIEQRNFVCTFNENILGQEKVKGSIGARLAAVKATDSDTVVFDLNNVETEVTIPGDGGIGIKSSTYATNNRISKGATGLSQASTGVSWVISVGGAWLVNNLPGSTQFTVVDTLPNELLTLTSNLKLITLSRQTPTSDGYKPVATADGVSTVEGYALKVTPDADGLTYRIDVTLPHEVTDQENLVISFPTTLTAGGTIDKGWTYTNSFRVEGVDQSVTGSKGYVETFVAEASYENAMGSFAVTKTALGSGTLSQTQEFAVQVSYELPANFAPPAGWTPPPNPFRFDLTLGTPTLNNTHLPAGTKVTLVEDMAVANASAADGVTWVSPTWSALYNKDASKFTIGADGSSVSFVIEDSKTLALALTNKSVTQSTFQVVKRIVGDSADRFAQDSYDFTYTCTDPATGTVTTGRIDDVPGDGTPVKPKADDGSERVFPVDTECTVSEETPAVPNGYTLTKATDETVTVMNAVQTAEMVNTYQADAELFSIVKNLNPGNSRGMDTFQVTYVCTQDGYGVTVGDPAVSRTGTVTITAGKSTPIGRFPAGTQCQVADEADQIREGFDLTKELGARVVITTGGANETTVTNTYTMQMGTFKIKKAVAGDALAGVNTNVSLTVAYTCTPPLRTGLAPISGYATGQIDLANGGEILVQDTFPVNSECVITGETGAELDGYTLQSNLGQPVKIAKGEVKEITLTNTYSRDHGTFTITKDLADGGSTGNPDFQVSYTCTEPARDGGAVTTANATISAGNVTSIGRFPTGTICQVDSETAVERVGFSQEIRVGDPVTMVKNQDSNITVSNIYTRDYAEFLVAKRVNAGGSTGTDTFTINYECDHSGFDRNGDPVPPTGSVQVTENQSTEVGKFPTGAVCKVTGEDEQAAARTNFDLSVDTGTEVTITRGVASVATVTNTYTPHVGSFRILKQEQGLPTAATARTVQVMYQCTPPTGLGSVSTGAVEVTVGQEYTVGQYPVGTECLVTAENAPAMAGYTLAKDLGSAVTISKDDTTQALQVTNTYTRDTGFFAITKDLVAGGSTGATTFNISYECQVPGTDAGEPAETKTGQVEVAAGQTKRVGEFPVGTVCKATSEDPAPRTDYTLTTDLGGEVTVAKGQQSVTKVTNTYTRDMGDFVVEKAVVANGSTGADQFTLQYECELPDAADDEDPQRGTVVVSEGGRQVVGSYPTGTVCRVTGEAQTAEREGYTLTTDFGGDHVVTGGADPAALVVTNTYTRQMGNFQIAKELLADGSTGSDVFKVHFKCQVPGEADAREGFVNVQAGTTATAGSYPTGTVCELTDEENTSRPGWSLETDLGAQVTITQAGPNLATVTNTYTRDRGTFVVTKQVVDGGSTGNDTFTVDYECTAAGKDVPATGSVRVTAGQDTVVGEFPTGTDCRVTGEDRAAANRDGYSLGVSYGDPVTIVKDTQAKVTVTNTYERQRGGFVINKTVAGDATDLAPDTFSFTYTCADSAPVTVDVTPGQPLAVTDVPTGQCTITEADASVQFTDLETRIEVDGAVSDGTFTVRDQASTEVAVTNTYSAQRGTFEVVKTVDSDDDDLVAGPFTFNYDCDGLEGTLQVPGDGTPVAGPTLRLGTTCIIAEERASAEQPNYELTAPTEQVVELTSEDDPIRASFVNKYRRHTADFAVSKTVTGGDFAASSYTFNYTCGDVSGSLEVKGDGVAVPAGVNLPTGTVCTVTEDSSKAARDGYDLEAPSAQQVTLTDDGSVVELSFVNAYTKRPTPEPTPTPAPTPVKPTPVPVKPGLPKTGS